MEKMTKGNLALQGENRRYLSIPNGTAGEMVFDTERDYDPAQISLFLDRRENRYRVAWIPEEAWEYLGQLIFRISSGRI